MGSATVVYSRLQFLRGLGSRVHAMIAFFNTSRWSSGRFASFTGSTAMGTSVHSRLVRTTSNNTTQGLTEERRNGDETRIKVVITT